MLHVERVSGGEDEMQFGFDPLRCRATLNMQRVFFPLGFPVEVKTNSIAILEAAEERWGHFVPLFQEPKAKFQINVSDHQDTAHIPEPTYRSQGNILSIIADANNFAICDLDKGFAFSWLTSSTVRDKNYTQYFFIEAVAMCLLSSLCVTPVHAACVEHEGHGVLLCGESGAGKSSLAFACAKSGWAYISDDASYIVQNRSDNFVVGNSHQIRFRPSASQVFSELEGLDITPRATGKPSIEVPIVSLGTDIKTVSFSNIEHVVFLNRKDAHFSALYPFPKNLARRRLQHSLFGTHEMQSAQTAALDSLLSARVSELCYRDIGWAVKRLETLVQEKG